MALYSILIVEDDEIDMMNIERCFSKIKCKNIIYKAKNGLDALNLIKSESAKKPLLVLLDINMPIMNGFEFLTEIRNDSNWTNTPVVMLTTSNLEVDKLNAYNLGISGYIVKPMSLDGFADALSKIQCYWSLCEFPPEVK